LTVATQHVDTPAILREGAYYILDDYAMREEMYAKVKKAFFDGIEQLAGADIRSRVEAAGLAKMHEHFPVAKLLLLEDYLHKTLQRDLFYWSFRVGRDDLGIDGTFYVDHLIVMRIHYPFLIARQAKNLEKPAYPVWEKTRLGIAALKNWRMLANEVSKARAKRLEKSGFDADSYHHRLPEVARAHGAHIDTWYGHSYDGINLWWSIDGVNADNTMILYPGMWGYTYPFDPKNMYLAEGVPVTQPTKVLPKPGQLLVFNPETLHGTQVNISDETRIVVSTRLNPGQPRFDLNAAWSFEYWHASNDLERRRFTAMAVFPAKDNRGKPSFTPKAGLPVAETRLVQVEGRVSQEEDRTVCTSADLKEGEKLAVNFDNAKMLLVRAKGEVCALARICPHLGYDMRNGHTDDETISCPGHGVSFSLADGTSHCTAFKLRRYQVSETGGEIRLRQAPADTASAPTQ
jgi:nitrite reductase/ring-hydroxylating ferredoxin subunit